ncbi:hypothetical protein [Spiroplasma endosymbiont of Apeira syringaria]|uniref:hypothetical protein n=1 Tax=Spiroplasma endosymbiont of Apeira syringaria TaxID=3066307 RepID=UPI0030CD1082
MQFWSNYYIYIFCDLLLELWVLLVEGWFCKFIAFISSFSNINLGNFDFVELVKAFLPLCTILILSHKCWEKPIYGLLPTFLNQK